MLLIGVLPFQGVLLIGALPFQGMLLIGVADLYLTFNKRFSEITLFPTRRSSDLKALKPLAIYKAVALTGRIAYCLYTQGDALG